MFGGCLGDTRSEFSLQTEMGGNGGQKIQLKSVKAGKKGKLFCPIAFRWWFPRTDFHLQPRGPTFSSCFQFLEFAISVGENDARRYPAGVVSGRVQNC